MYGCTIAKEKKIAYSWTEEKWIGARSVYPRMKKSRTAAFENSKWFLLFGQSLNHYKATNLYVTFGSFIFWQSWKFQRWERLFWNSCSPWNLQLCLKSRNTLMPAVIVFVAKVLWKKLEESCRLSVQVPFLNLLRNTNTHNLLSDDQFSTYTH